MFDDLPVSLYNGEKHLTKLNYLGDKMYLQGELIAESPLYRGNARKTLFTRDGDGKQRLVSLAGEISGTAQSLMDAFIGRSKNGRNIGLLEQLWQRLYKDEMPRGLIGQVECYLQEESYPRDNFFDMRMGLRLDEDRWAVESNANYKMETILRHSVFNLTILVNDQALAQNDNQSRLYYLLQELIAGRFWFGAAKSKGLGRLRLNMDIPFAAPAAPPKIRSEANHLSIAVTFDATNPVLVGWNWGKVDPSIAPAFTSIEGRLLLEAMQDLPDTIRQRLEMSIGGPMLNPDDWKSKLANYLPRVIAIWLQEQSGTEKETWFLPADALKKMGKGKHGLSKKIISNLEPLADKPFPGEAAASAAVEEALADKVNMLNRVMKNFEVRREAAQEFDPSAWQELAGTLGMDANLSDTLAGQIEDEAALTQTLSRACRGVLSRLYQQVDQQIHLLQSDAWLDAEIANREGHLRIKQMLLRDQINEAQWNNRNQPPQGIGNALWREFLDSHSRVRFHHLKNPRNLNKSIVNDQNFISFLQYYRDRARQELSQPYHIDFREGGPFSREVSRKYGKPYDTMFMRMLSWAPSAREEGGWEIYIPGSTVKGAFRKRASQLLQTLWNNSNRAQKLLDRLFGRQRQRGLVFFSDAYLVDPYEPEENWCVMDGVKMDPKTGKPVEGAKQDYLFAYGDQLNFRLQLDLQDMSRGDMEAIDLLAALLQDFQQGDIPLGGEKTSGFGWVQANITGLTWLTGGSLTQHLFGEASSEQAGIWQQLKLEGDSAAEALQAIAKIPADAEVSAEPPRTRAGFISHRAFGGYSGHLAIEAEILTPTHVRESGQPSYRTSLDNTPVNGWDNFTLAPAEAERRRVENPYALPSKSLRGMLRHIYTIASDSARPSPDISRLNPADSLFGWVGTGPNQAIMGRVVVDFGLFDAPELGWFKVPYPYGGWRFVDGRWQNNSAGTTAFQRIAKQWRIFPHVPLAPIAEPLSEFSPDTVQASYVRAILPGARARFNIRFWNLEEEELQRLIWCVSLEGGAHKIGKHRHLGFGSLRLHLLPECHLIDWPKRYASGSAANWQQPLDPAAWLNPQIIQHYQELRQITNVDRL